MARLDGGGNLLGTLLDVGFDLGSLVGREVPFLGTIVGAAVDWLAGRHEDHLEADMQQRIDRLETLMGSDATGGNDEGPAEDVQEGLRDGFGGF